MEATQVPLVSRSSNVLGYWVLEETENYVHKFVWLNSVPTDIRGLDQNKILQSLPSNSTHRRMLENNIKLAFDHARTRALDLDLDVVSAIGSGNSRDHFFAVALWDVLGRSHDHNYDFTLILDLIVKHIILDVDQKRKGFRMDRVRSSDLYIDIFTIFERIAGRSPAFEGIRLVKERIR